MKPENNAHLFRFLIYSFLICANKGKKEGKEKNEKEMATSKGNKLHGNVRV